MIKVGYTMNKLRTVCGRGGVTYRNHCGLIGEVKIQEITRSKKFYKKLQNQKIKRIQVAWRKEIYIKFHNTTHKNRQKKLHK